MAKMSWREACRLDTTLASLTHFFPSPPEYAQTLVGGLTNRCWRIERSADEHYVWRPVTTITKAFAISRFQEYQILKAIEQTQLGPKAITINDQGLLVEWVAGQALMEGLASDSLIPLLAKIHQTSVTRLPVAPFNYTARVDHYWLQLPDELKSAEYEALYHQWRSAPSCSSIPASLCHFDFAGYNIIQTNTGYRVIDWEYATLADPRLDLALMIEASELSLLECVFRYCHYRQIDQVDEWIAGVKMWQPRCQLMAMLWYLLAFQLWGDGSYLQQAVKLQQTLAVFSQQA
ncbi:phosphotransferase [Vibrio metschnikovii]|uniref:phosphotransferase n=1 Tax=Vibrio metschnikovii TaxID=28172 RepID=UPI001C2FFBB8|nr:phosphotransferase [Vibrio metschnikovii]